MGLPKNKFKKYLVDLFAWDVLGNCRKYQSFLMGLYKRFHFLIFLDISYVNILFYFVQFVVFE